MLLLRFRHIGLGSKCSGRTSTSCSKRTPCVVCSRGNALREQPEDDEARLPSLRSVRALPLLPQGSMGGRERGRGAALSLLETCSRRSLRRLQRGVEGDTDQSRTRSACPAPNCARAQGSPTLSLHARPGEGVDEAWPVVPLAASAWLAPTTPRLSPASAKAWRRTAGASPTITASSQARRRRGTARSEER